MALTAEQIEQLFAFTRKKYVHYYDLQVELVDHLASSIEEEMAANEQLSFDQALHKVYNRFGIFGFAKVVQEREATVLRNNRRIWWHAVKAFFTIPKIALTALIFATALFAGQFLPGVVKGSIIFGLWFICIIMEWRFAIKAKNESKKPLLLTQYTSFFSCFTLIIPYHIFVLRPTFENNLVFASFLVLSIIFESAVIEVNQHIRTKAKQLYPQAFA